MTMFQTPAVLERTGHFRKNDLY